jgi:hypothetical protein
MTVQEWFLAVSPNVAIFFGAVTGSFVGLFALLLGALYNARLNRARDTRVRTEERKSLAAALSAELCSVADALNRNRTHLQNPIDIGGQQILVPDIAHSIRIFPGLIDKLGLLDAETIRKVIDAHILIDQYCEMLLIHGAIATPGRRIIRMEAQDRGILIAADTSILEQIKAAIESLDCYLRPPNTL